jgi:(p)ppGpp synthase/HD superfamily hydrolase
MNAREFAIKAHGDQTYGVGLPYSYHLQHVAEVLVRFRVFSIAMAEAAWLHDVLEDTKVTGHELWDNFGPEVANLVAAVTDEPGANRKERHIKTLPKIRAAGTNAVVLKLADRIANTEAAIWQRPDLLKMYRSEFPEFSTALFQPGECDDMWHHLRKLSVEEEKR